MFAVQCPRHGQRVLLPTSAIRGMVNTDSGIVVIWECWCRHLGRSVTGKNANREPARPHAA